MQVSILEPKGVIWEGNAKKVTLPTEEGEACIMDFHQSFFMRLKKGSVILANRRTVIKEGIAFMRSNELKILVET